MNWNIVHGTDAHPLHPEAVDSLAALLDEVRQEERSATFAEIRLHLSDPEIDVERWREAVYDFCKSLEPPKTTRRA